MGRDLNQQQLTAAIDAAREALERVADLASPANETQGRGAAKLLFEERRRRDDCFPAGVFREPAWDIMLVLFIARDQGRELGQGDALRYANVPPTTGLRMFEQLEEAGLVKRRVGDRWKNKRIVSLTDDAGARMARFLSGSPN